MADDGLSRVFAALADPTRRDMVARLAVGDATVGELADPYDVSIQAVRQTSRGEDALLIIVTHEARDADLAATISELQALPVVRAVASVMRVEGEGDQ